MTPAARPPELSDGVVLLRAFEQSDVDGLLPLEDIEMRRWFDFARPPSSAKERRGGEDGDH